MITLYGSGNSPYVRKVRVVLAETGLPFTYEPTDTDNLPAGYANPNRRVPLLEDDGRAVFESNVIVDYLLQRPGQGAGAGGNPPLAKALTRPEHHWDDLMVLVTIETLLNSAMNLRNLSQSGVTAERTPYLQAEQRRIQSELDWLEARATPEGFVPGTFSIADLNWCCAAEWLDFRQPAPWRGRPTLEALVARYRDRPSMADTRPGQ